MRAVVCGVVVAVVVALAMSQGVSAGNGDLVACLEGYTLNMGADICNALNELDICISAIESDSDEYSRALRALNVAKFQHRECDVNTELNEARAEDDGNINFFVKRDATFRQRRAEGDDAVSAWELKQRVDALKYKAMLLARTAELDRIQARFANVLAKANLTDSTISAVRDSVGRSTFFSDSTEFHAAINDVATALHQRGVSHSDVSSLFDLVGNENTEGVAIALADREYAITRWTDIENARVDGEEEVEIKSMEDSADQAVAYIEAIGAENAAFIADVGDRIDAVRGAISDLENDRSTLQGYLSGLGSFANNVVASLPAYDTKHYVHSGYCNHHGQSGGWNNYCFSTTEFNNANNYFEVTDRSNGVFTARQQGFIRINYWGITSACDWAHINLIVNGAIRHYGHENAFGTWSDNFMDITWRVNPGDNFYVRVYQRCGGTAYHSGNANGAHSRLQISWDGA